MTESGHGYATDDDGGSRLGELVQWAMGHMGHIGACSGHADSAKSLEFC